jgi:hypothetical protein
VTLSTPFDTSLPSPLKRLSQLRARASEAVVRDERPSDVQRLMAPRGRLEDSLWEVLGGPSAPALLVLTGSAGCGKSATINHLLEREAETGADRVGAHLADATHSDAPDQAQAERLASFFADFADGAAPAGGPCRVVAMNTGMALRFFHELRTLRDAPPLTGLEGLLRRRLGLPGGDAASPGWLHDAVLVVNLDHRPTAGRPGDLFDDLLERLDPARADGVLEGAPRCATCAVRNWCWPMANALSLSSAPGRAALNAAVGDVALARGRQVPPRALWDLVAELALGGVGDDDDDPCYRIARVAAEQDEQALARGLACNVALTAAQDGTLLGDVAARDPGYQASEKAHAIVSDAGLDPDADARHLTEWLAGGREPHPAVTYCAAILADGRLWAPDGARYWGRMLARAGWFGGELQGRTELPAEFADALAAQSVGATEADGSPEGTALDTALATVEAGLAGAFGLQSGPERFYPTSTPHADATAELLVEAKLIDTGQLTTVPDPVIEANASGARIVGYRPLTLAVEAAGRRILVDYPLWRLLHLAAAGGAPSTVELERFLALRQAIRQVGVLAASDHSRPLLVREIGAGARRFRVTVRNPTTLVIRASEVV